MPQTKRLTQTFPDRSLVLGFLTLLLSHTVVRGLFMAGNWNRFRDATIGEILFSFFVGLRFDAALLASTTGVFFLFFAATPSLPANIQSLWRRIFLTATILLNLVAVALGVADVGYYPMGGRRSTFELITTLLNDWAQIVPMSKAYPVLWLLTGIIAVPIVWGLLQFSKGCESLRRLPGRAMAVWYLILLGTIVVTFRGGLQIKPLAITHAYALSAPALGDLALNTGFSVSRTFGNHSLDDPSYFESWDEVLSLLRHPAVAPAANAVTPLPSTALDFPTRPNFIVIVVESLASEYSNVFGGKVSYTPFLDSLASESLVFENFFANGRRSIEASTSIFFGIPSLMPDPLIQSPYASSDLRGLPALLGPLGYSSQFFHGGAKGSMFFDIMAKKARFQEHLSAEEFPDQTQNDGSWGIYDRPFFKWAAQKMTTINQPFVAGMFTLSSHSPYVIPAAEKGKFPKGTLDIHEAIGYTDDALRDFFAEAKKQPWFQNTIFFITGDHTSLSSLQNFSELGLYRVPLLIYQPGNGTLRGKDSSVAQHVDILPTIVGMAAGGRQQGPLFGRPLVTNDGRGLPLALKKGRSINSLAGVYWYSDDTAYARFDGKGGWEFSTIPPLDGRPAPLEDHQHQEELKKRLLAHIQYFNHGLKEGKLYEGRPQ